MEGIGKEVFEEWMKRLMERIDRLDSIISVLINKEAAGVKYMDGERLYDNQDLCEMLRTSKRSLQRFRSEYGLRYRKISRKSYYKESDVLEFISRNMEEVTLDGKRALKVKEGTGKKAPGKTEKGKKEAEGIPGLKSARETEAKRKTGRG